MTADLAKELEDDGTLGTFKEAFGKLLDNTLYSLIPIMKITEKQHYEFYMNLLDRLLGLANSDEAEFAKVTLNGLYLIDLSAKIEEYEAEKFPINDDVSGVEVLKYLMDANELTQSDFDNEIGPQSNVSAILSGKRKLTIEHVAKLSTRFNISPAAFIKGSKD